MNRSCRRTSIWVLAWCATLVLFSNCATQRIAGDTFIEASKGYQFVIPGPDWPVDEDAWVYERDFGYLLVKKKPRRAYRRTVDEKGNPIEDLDVLPSLPPKILEKLIFDMDIGFRHKTHDMILLAATAWERELLDLLKEGGIKTDSDFQNNLIKAYFERFPDFHRPKTARRPVITIENFPRIGEVPGLKWTGADAVWAMRGIRLDHEFLFFLLRVDKETPAAVLAEGMQALNEIVATIVLLKKQ